MVCPRAVESSRDFMRRMLFKPSSMKSLVCIAVLFLVVGCDDGDGACVKTLCTDVTCPAVR